jgi:DNA-binding NarL/FixJ family response regulator
MLDDRHQPVGPILNATAEKRITIIVAGDHPLFRKGLADLLRDDEALELLAEAEDGQAAIQAINELKPQVAVLDIEMPGLSGIEIARELHLAENKDTSLILVTAYKEPEMFDEALDNGVKGYVLKENAIVDILNGIRAVAKGEDYISPSLAGLLLKRWRASEDLRQENPGLDRLSPAERRILKLISLDRTTKEIADDLGISPRTVENHRANIARKVGISGTHSLLKFAFQNRSSL